MHFYEPIAWMAMLFLALLFKSIYNTWFHPLRNFPGPWYCGASRLWFSMKIFQGTLNHETKILHDIYGGVVRIAPDELSYNTSDAWQPIYGRNESTGQPFTRDPKFYGGMLAESMVLVTVDGKQNRDQKAPLLEAFSRKMIIAREHILSTHFDDYSRRLQERHSTALNTTIDLNSWMENLLFDIITTTTVGKRLGAINHYDKAHPAVRIYHKAMSFIEIYTELRRLPRICTWLFELLPCILAGPYDLLGSTPFIGLLIKERFETGSPQCDFVSYMLQDQDLARYSHKEALKNAMLLILAGTETTTSGLLGVIYFLLNDAKVLLKASKEVRERFKKEEELTILSTQDLAYLQACQMEALRIYPPAGFAAPRRVPSKGAIICGRYIPGNSVVGVNHWAVYHSATNFKDPEDFRPQRWLGDAQYEGDDLNAVKPWGYGPRMCLAKEMAKLNATYLLARFLWKFSLEIDERSLNWHKQKGHVFPQRGKLFVNIRDRAER